MRRDARYPVRVGGAERLVAAAHHHHVAGLYLHPGAIRHFVQLLRRDGIADGHVALAAPGRYVKHHAARLDALVEDRVDGAPGGALRGQAVGERPAVVQLAVPGHVAQRVHVGDPETVVHHVEAVQHYVHALPLGGKGNVVHVDRARHHVARQRHRQTAADEVLGGRLLGRRDQVQRAELVVVTPATPVVQLLEIALHAILRR